MTLAKGLGSGVPIGACLALGVAADTFVPGKHGSTFGGGALACTAALTTLQVMKTTSCWKTRRRSAPSSVRPAHAWPYRRRARGARPGPDDRHRNSTGPAATW